MSILTDLRAALDAALASEQMKGKVWDDFRDLLDTDTIRALLDVTEAVAVADPCIFCNKDDESRHHPHCPLAPLVKEADDE